MAAELGIRPWEANRFQPAEIWALQQGNQRRWNRMCELVAWSTWLIAGSRMSGASHFGEFLQAYPPPGYAPKSPVKVKKAKRV